jgi:hypothetical protein
MPGEYSGGAMSAPPELRAVATFGVTVASPVVVSQAADGVRRLVPITGGTVVGPRLNGRILSAGADFQTIRHDGLTVLDARYVIVTTDGASIAVSNMGLRHGPPELMALLMRGEPVDPAAIYFRTMPQFTTDHSAYDWLARSLFIGAGRRFPNRVEIDVFEVL